MKNVTISVDEETARWAKVWAAKQGKSVSRLLGEVLQALMRRDVGYDVAKRRFLGRAPTELGAPAAGYPSRDELHER